MTFGQSYLDHMRCLEDVGMLSTTPINFNGQEIVPIQFLKALLPDPASLGPRTKGKTNIGCIYEFALPKEWSRQEQIQYTADYIQKTFVDKGQYGALPEMSCPCALVQRISS